MGKGNYIQYLVDRIAFFMGLDYDSDFPFFKPGKYLRALNIHHLTRSGSTTGSVEIVKGNELAYTLPFITVQDKVFRVYIYSDQLYTYQFDYYDGNGVLLVTGTPKTLTTNNINTSLAEIAAQIIADMGNANINGGTGIPITPLTTTEGYLEFSITTVPHWDYSITESLTLSSVDVDRPLFIITQEAIDWSMVGQLQTICSFDLLGDVIIWSANYADAPMSVDVLNATSVGSEISIEIADTTIFANNNELVVIAGVLGTIEANGSWIINITDATHFNLLGSTFTNAYVSGGTVTLHSLAYGQIGVAQKDDNNQTWSYIPLLSSREFNFRIKKQLKARCQKSSFFLSFYYTGDDNVPRVTYYNGPYMTNGCLTYINPLGQYQYGSIAEEIQMILNTSTFDVQWVNQLQSGGGVLAGNHRYAIRLLTENFSPTLLTDPTNPVNVCIQNSLSLLNVASVYPIGGNDSFATTGKQNVLLISGIIPLLFKYVELIDLYYVDGSIVPICEIVKRELLTQEATQTIIHTGLEQDKTAFDVANFSAVSSDIATAKCIEIEDNHLVLANTTSSDVIDFSDFSATFTHTIVRTTIDGVRIPYSGTYRSGEYITPFNVNGKVGYMFNEIYAVYAKYRLKTGFITEAFWVNYIRVDTLVDNLIANPDGITGRRTGSALASYDLTDSSGNNVYVPYIEHQVPSMDFIVNGVRARDLIDEIIFERVDMIPAYREVLGSGNFIVGLSAYDQGYVGNAANYGGNTPGIRDEYPTTFSADQLGEFPFASGMDFYDTPGTPVPNNPTVGDILAILPTPPVLEDQLGSFYIEDMIYGETDIQFQSGDQILLFGEPDLILDEQHGVYGINGGLALFTVLREFSGANNTNTYQSVIIDEQYDVAMGGTVTIAGKQYTKTRLIVYDPNNTGVNLLYYYANSRSLVSHVTTPITVNSAGYGVLMSQYYRFKSINGGISKFGSKTGVKTVPTGLVYKVTSTTPTSVTGLAMFGGDVFVQKTYIKHRIPQTDPGQPVNGFWVTGFGGGFGVYSQNFANTQMRPTAGSIPSFQQIAYRYPAISASFWLENVDTIGLAVRYNSGYDIINSVVVDGVFDPNLPRSTAQPAHIPWSDEKPENSVLDNFRNFQPLNVKDLDISYGQITEIVDINGELLTLQDKHFEFQYFNTTGMMVASNTDVVLGNAGIMTQKARTLSTYGSKHRFGIIKGKTDGGKDSLYWISSPVGKVMRYEPSDGTVCLSDVHEMRSFFNNNLRFADLFDIPAYGLGIHGVYDDQNSEAIWTIRAYKTGIDAWDDTIVLGQPYVIFYTYNNPTPPIFSSGEAVTGDAGGDGTISNTSLGQLTVTSTTQLFQVSEIMTGVSSGAVGTITSLSASYSLGDVVSYLSTEFEGFPDFYRSLVDNNGDNPAAGAAATPPTWEKISKEDPDFYNVYTIAFSEKLNQFTTFYSFKPKIYLKRWKEFLSPRPISNEGNTYVHLSDNSDYATWYHQNAASPVEQTQDAYIDMVYGRGADQPKSYMAIGTNAEIIPFEIDVTTKTNTTFMVAADTEGQNGEWLTAVKNDSTGTGVTDGNTDQPNGSYAIIRYVLEKKVYQKITSVVLKFFNLPRSTRM